MVITSKNKSQLRRYGRVQYRYALVYVIVTFVVLVFLNLHTSSATKRLFEQNQKTFMLEKASAAADEIGELATLEPESISVALNRVPNLRLTQIVVTDASGLILFDSNSGSTLGAIATFPQLEQVMEGKTPFSWDIRNNITRSEAAAPIRNEGKIVGCIYLLDEDPEYGTLLQNLQRNILYITMALELLVICFSLAFARAFSGRLRRVMESIRILREGDFNHRVAVTGHDELTVLAEEFNDMADRLQISENKRRQFVSDASHELKTPLASIKLLSDSILQNDMDIDTIREFVSDIGNEAERLNRMSEKLLRLTRSEGEPEPDRDTIHMAPTIQRVVKMLAQQAESMGVEIVTNLDQDSPIVIREDDFYQILFNLTENGIKYNHFGGKLTISVEQGGTLKVCDTGTGIPDESLGHIFERFYRVDKARSRATGGSGLGLAIVRNMVERNQGKIQVESVLGKGTTFTLTFPTPNTEGDNQ